MCPAPSHSEFGPTTQFDTQTFGEALPEGTRLGGYQIVDVLARGEFGIVYLALDSSLQRQVAIKEFLPTGLVKRDQGPSVALKPGASETAFAAGLAGFLSEAKLLTRLEHPALARVHSYWEENGTAYMVMPYSAGHSLAATLRTWPQPPDELWLRALLAPLLGGLSMLHTAQCYHRDISPETVFIQTDGRPLLTDFGAASPVGNDKAMPLESLLNLAYAPIELYAEGSTLPQGPWTDLYALAGVLRFAITGQAPMRAPLRTGSDPQRPLAEAVRALQAKHPGLRYSAAFLAGIDKALSPLPKDRPRSVADFQRLLNEEGAKTEAAQPTPPPTPAKEWFASSLPGHDAVAGRRKGPVGVIVLCVAVAAASAAWWWLQVRPAPMRVAASVVAASEPVPVLAPIASAAPVVATAASEPVIAVATAAPEPALASASAAASMPAASIAPTAPAASAAIAPAATAPMATAEAAAKEPASPEPKRNKKDTRAAAAPEEASTPRGMCGTRANFALYYCMQQQCKRPKFSQHPQCVEVRQRGE